MAKFIIIGSKLPFGLLLEHPQKPGVSVEIEGLNKSRIIGAAHMTTPVDADFWADYKATHGKASFLANGSIFEAATLQDAEAAARDLEKQRTGLEPLSSEGQDGVKPLDKKS